jgi:hypothetical protein
MTRIVIKKSNTIVSFIDWVRKDMILTALFRVSRILNEHPIIIIRKGFNVSSSEKNCI